PVSLDLAGVDADADCRLHAEDALKEALDELELRDGVAVLLAVPPELLQGGASLLAEALHAGADDVVDLLRGLLPEPQHRAQAAEPDAGGFERVVRAEARLDLLDLGFDDADPLKARGSGFVGDGELEVAAGVRELLPERGEAAFGRGFVERADAGEGVVRDVSEAAQFAGGASGARDDARHGLCLLLAARL